MTKNYLSLTIVAALFMTACTQTTPSMMNNERVQVTRESLVEQIPLEHLNKNTVAVIANEYNQKGTGEMDLTMTFDPTSKSFTAMNAVNTVKKIQKDLNISGVKATSIQTLAVPGGTPSLVVSFDSMRAQAPKNCDQMPGLDDNQTGRFIGDYKFGCGIETAFSKQIARPSDLYGNGNLAKRDARRESIVVDDYASAQPRTPLEGIERADLASGN